MVRLHATICRADFEPEKGLIKLKIELFLKFWLANKFSEQNNKTDFDCSTFKS